MRIFGIEISRAPSTEHPRVWNRGEFAPLGRRVEDMTPEQLREALSWVLQELAWGNQLVISTSDTKRRITSHPRYIDITPYTKEK